MGAARSSHWIEERLRRRVESLLVLLGAEEVARPSIDVVIASARKARIQFRCAPSERAMGLGIARVLPALLSAALLLQAYGREASAATKTEHIRGTIESVEGEVVTVATSSGSERIQLAPSTPIARVVQSDRAHITDGASSGSPRSRTRMARSELSKSTSSRKRCAGRVRVLTAGIGVAPKPVSVDITLSPPASSTKSSSPETPTSAVYASSSHRSIASPRFRTPSAAVRP